MRFKFDDVAIPKFGLSW